MDKHLLTVIMWLLFLGGLFGFVMGLQQTIGGGNPAEYGVMGIGGGLWFLFATITAYVKNKI